ncbi:Ig-like domain-containing protein, partial [bacterium]|nr:Ig-like domain-containing protein [bacterium]
EGAIHTVGTGGGADTARTQPGADTDRDVTWAPDGGRLLFSRGDAVGGARGIFSVLAGRDTTEEAWSLDEITTDTTSVNIEPAQSRDGRWIAFSSDRDGDFDVYVMDSRGEEYGLFRVTNDGGADGQPTWIAPDSLSFVSDRAGNEDVYVASGLPFLADADSDFVADVVDTLCGVPLDLGELDTDFDGCADSTASLRSIRYRLGSRMPVVYEVTTQCDPRITSPSDFTAIRTAFQTWAATAVPGAGLTASTVSFVADTTHQGPRIAVFGDGRNSITFEDPRAVYPGVLAITFVTSAVYDTVIAGRWCAPGEIVDADILFNKDLYTFGTDGDPGGDDAFDLVSVATHEVGHLFGLSHTAIPSATMFYVIPQGPAFRSLARDDSVTVGRAYPAAPPVLAAEGTVFRPDSTTPVPAAGVIAISEATGDSLQMTFTDAQGVYRLYDIPEAFRIRTFPLDGGPDVHYLAPSNVNTLVDFLSQGQGPFLAEYWNTTESAIDDPDLGDVIPAGPAVTGADIILNQEMEPPTIDLFVPADGDSVPATAVVSVRFSEPVTLESLQGAIDFARQGPPPVPLSGIASLVNQDRVVIFRPDALLLAESTYVFTIDGVEDVFGNPMESAATVTFHVEQATDLVLVSIDPPVVPVGGVLALAGSGFSPSDTANTVAFLPSGATAVPFSSTLDRLYVVVPPGVTDGSVYVTVDGAGAPSDSLPIDVADPIDVPSGNRRDSLVLPGAPKDVVVEPATARAWIATGSGVTTATVGESDGLLTGVDSMVVPGGCTGITVGAGSDSAYAIGPVQPRLRLLTAGGAEADTASLADEPLGVALVPGGHELLITTANRVILCDARPGPTFGQELRQWPDTTGTFPDTFRGDVAVAPDARNALVPTGNGDVAVLGLGDAFFQEVFGGTEPRGSAFLPDGERFLAADEIGNVRLHRVRGSQLQSRSFAGGFRGVTISPEGDFAYLANFIRNRVQIMDLRGNNLLDAGEFPTSVDPVDVATAWRGRYVLVVAAFPLGEPVLEVYDTQATLRVDTVSPSSGGPGTLVTIAGSGFSVTDSVTIGGKSHTAIDGDGSHLVVRQAPATPSGAVVVHGANEQSSNARPYRAINRPDQLRFEEAGRIHDGGAGSNAMLLSPDGAFLFCRHDDGAISLVGADPSAALGVPDTLSHFHRLITTWPAGVTQLQAATGPLAMTPDGRRLFAADGDSIGSFLFDAVAANLVRTGTVGVPQPAALAMAPDGRRMAVASGTDSVYWVDTVANAAVSSVPV